MSRKVSLYVKDILQNMDDAAEFIHEITYGQFFTDKRTQYAVLRAVEIIGEAAKNVPDDIRVRYPEVPWKEMAGMRDKVVHRISGSIRKLSG